MCHTPPGDESLPRIYLDHAATSWPKLPSAVSAAFDFIQNCGASSGRGAYRSAQLADRWLADARLAVARLIQAPNSNSIAFCSSGTHALNAALLGLLRSGEHVVTTAIEHNSVLRPLSQMVNSHRVAMTVAACDARGLVSVDSVAESLRAETKWIVLGHASNVTGTVQAIEPIAALAHRSGAKLIVDASQTLGYIPIDVQAMGIDVLAAAGHKGLRALAGTGVLYIASQLQSQVRPLMSGGTGQASTLIDAAAQWPQSVEVGNLNLPGIVSLAVAAAEANTDQSWRPLYRELLTGLRGIAGLRLFEGADDSIAIPLVSLKVDGWDHHDLASVMDANFGIEARAGLHCAALVHNFIGSMGSNAAAVAADALRTREMEQIGVDLGGTLRLSLGHDSTRAEVQAAVTALRIITGHEIEET
jgi:cysteine desulfurase/selenocysteine lyase